MVGVGLVEFDAARQSTGRQSIHQLGLVEGINEFCTLWLLHDRRVTIAGDRFVAPLIILCISSGEEQRRKADGEGAHCQQDDKRETEGERRYHRYCCCCSSILSMHTLSAPADGDREK